MKTSWSLILGILAVTLFSVIGIAMPAGAADCNLPGAIVGRLSDSDAVMRMMETPVKPEVLAAFEKAHPAPFWLSGEDRQRAVRRNIMPAHWFENNAQSWNKFSGVARPGEFYVFQVCVVFAKDARNLAFLEAQISDLPGAEIYEVTRSIPLRPGEVKPVWVAVEVPSNANPGEYHGTATMGNAKLDLTLTIAGEPIAESGTGEAWRLARLKWLDSDVGESETVVTRPFTPIRVNEQARTLEILGRRITLGPDGIPAQFTSYFSDSNTKILAEGTNAFASPPRLECLVGGKAVPWKTSGLTSLEFRRQTPVGVEWEVVDKPGDLSLLVRGRLEFDGHLQLQMHLASDVPVTVDEVRFVVPWAKDRVKYAMGLGLQGGICPQRHDWKWDVTKHQDAIWLGDVNQGLMLRFKGSNYFRPLINAYYDFCPLHKPDSWGGGGINIENHSGQVRLTAKSGKLRISNVLQPNLGLFGDCGDFVIDWYFTPFKPLDTHEHFTDRFYHAGQGAGMEDTAAIRKQGANIIEVHHNRLCNPYINYPFNDDSIANLTKFVKKAHAAGVRGKRLLHDPRAHAEPAGVFCPEEPRRRGDSSPPARRLLACHQSRRSAPLAARARRHGHRTGLARGVALPRLPQQARPGGDHHARLALEQFLPGRTRLSHQEGPHRRPVHRRYGPGPQVDAACPPHPRRRRQHRPPREHALLEPFQRPGQVEQQLDRLYGALSLLQRSLARRRFQCQCLTGIHARGNVGHSLRPDERDARSSQSVARSGLRHADRAGRGAAIRGIFGRPKMPSALPTPSSSAGGTRPLPYRPAIRSLSPRYFASRAGGLLRWQAGRCKRRRSSC